MNHPSEWAKCFDENVGRYRYKHKGSGLIRDTLMAIGKAFKGTAENVMWRGQPLKKRQKQSLNKRDRKLVKLQSKRVQNKFDKYCKSVSRNQRRCCRMLKRDLEAFYKIKCQKNLLHLAPF